MKTWKTIKLGNKEKALADLYNNHRVSEYAKDLISKIDFSKKEVNIPIVRIVLSDWFDHNPTTKEIFDRAKKEGLELCPSEVAIHLRNNYDEQELYSYTIIAHKPIKDYGGRPVLLHARRDGGGSWLNACWDNPAFSWLRDSGFAFAVSQVSTNDSEPQPYSDAQSSDLERAIGICVMNGYNVTKNT